MNAPELIDGLIDDRVVVFGSLPPAGRDIDIVARPAQLEAIDRGLRDEGFEAISGSLIRFRDCGVEAVELIPISRWGLPEDASRELFGSAIPLEGRTHLCRPSPAHAMLIAARRLVRERGTASGKAAGHFASALEEQPDAIGPARERSAAWGVAPALRALQSGDRLGVIPRVRGLYAERRRQGQGRLRTIAWAARHQVPRRRRRGALIALSGLDGSGKSTQAAALADTLCRLGFDARASWTPMTLGPWLGRIAGAIRPLLRPLVFLRARVGGSSPEPGRAGPAPAGADADAEPEPFLFMSPSLSLVWSTIVALRLSFRTGVVLRSEIWRGRVVVCDRYVLDAWTYMRYNYRAAPSLRVQFALMRLFSPKPLRAFALIVDPETATKRDPDFDTAENARRLSYYEESMDLLGVKQLDGGLPREAICSRIASEVYRALI